MSVVTKRKVGRSAVILAGLVLMSSVAACSRSNDTQADSKPAEPAAVSVSAPANSDAPLGEASPSASTAESAPPAENANTVQTAEPAPPSVVKATTPVIAADTSDGDSTTPKLSAEQQELAAEVGDTRHASAQAASDKTPD